MDSVSCKKPLEKEPLAFLKQRAVSRVFIVKSYSVQKIYVVSCCKCWYKDFCQWILRHFLYFFPAKFFKYWQPFPRVNINTSENPTFQRKLLDLVANSKSGFKWLKPIKQGTIRFVTWNLRIQKSHVPVSLKEKKSWRYVTVARRLDLEHHEVYCRCRVDTKFRQLFCGQNN
jgi:hypothetical protein